MSRRVLFDTSTLVGAVLRSGSVPYKALSRALQFDELCVSSETLAQLEAVLARGKFARYVPTEARLAFIETLRRRGRMFVIHASDMAQVSPRCRDASDDFILALATVAAIDVIVSSDQDLLALHPWRGIPILTPAQFLVESES